MMGPVRAVQRYAGLIRSSLLHALHEPTLAAPISGEVSMANGLVAVARRVGRFAGPLDPWIVLVDSLNESVRGVDGLGHRRSIYRPLLESTIRRASNRLRGSSFASVPEPTGVNAQAVAEAALSDLGAVPASRGMIERLMASQTADGTYLQATNADNPEPVWYYESIVLHAVGLHAAETGDARAIASMQRSAARFAREVQPDHASNQPWAMHAFVLEPEAIPLADMMLHAAGIQHPASMDAVSLILLSESLEAIENLAGVGA